ncbi:MAG: hypothetical protein HQ536_01540 [Parcubacteria group bacterium]|nr:hypothetical protein [Parcubacteria group bacterium]
MSSVLNRSKAKFVMIMHTMLDDPKFYSMKPRSQILWPYLRSKYNPYKIEINSATGLIQVRFPKKDLHKINGLSHPNTLRDALDELTKNEFIKVNQTHPYEIIVSFVGNYGKFPNSIKKTGKRK